MEQEIVTLQELDSEEWKARARESVECAYDEAGNSTVESDAQETLLNFILNIGGIRRDVYEYLLTPRFRDPSAVASVGILLCYGAPCEWIELVVEALDQNSVTVECWEIAEHGEEFKDCETCSWYGLDVTDGTSLCEILEERCSRKGRIIWND